MLWHVYVQQFVSGYQHWAEIAWLLLGLAVDSSWLALGWATSLPL